MIGTRIENTFIKPCYAKQRRNEHTKPDTE